MCSDSDIHQLFRTFLKLSSIGSLKIPTHGRTFLDCGSKHINQYITKLEQRKVTTS